VNAIPVDSASVWRCLLLSHHRLRTAPCFAQGPVDGGRAGATPAIGSAQVACRRLRHELWRTWLGCRHASSLGLRRALSGRVPKSPCRRALILGVAFTKPLQICTILEEASCRNMRRLTQVRTRRGRLGLGPAIGRSTAIMSFPGERYARDNATSAHAALLLRVTSARRGTSLRSGCAGRWIGECRSGWPFRVDRGRLGPSLSGPSAAMPRLLVR
jgi:hypothetical protein